MRIPSHHSSRRGVAAVEMAVVTLFFLIPMIIGIWEVGRLIHVKQVVSNSAREGARLAAQGFTIKGDGSYVQIKESTGNPNVKQVVVQYLRAGGLNVEEADVTVNFEFTSGRTTDYIPLAGVDPPGTSYPAGSMPPDPAYGDKGQEFFVFVSVPWEKVRWTNFGLVSSTDVQFTATWRMLVDDPFEVNTNLPTW